MAGNRRICARLPSAFFALTLAVSGLVFGGSTAAAAGEDELVIDITAGEHDYSEEFLADLGPQVPIPETVDAWCTATYTPAPRRTYTFNSITRGGVTTVLKADEYDPDPATYAGPFPIMVLAHGGGFARGCRKSMASVAYSFSSNPSLDKHFIVLSIDYRLACDPGDGSLGGGLVAQQHLCGWNFNSPDPAHGGSVGPAVHDLQDAVHWVRQSWAGVSDLAASWNGAVALVGGSGGGNLSQLASIQWPYTDYAGPEAVAGWSPFPRFTQYTSPVPSPHTTWACDSSQSHHPSPCAIGYSEDPLGGTPLEGGINRYLPCPDTEDPSYQSACAALYKLGAPYDVVLVGPGFLAPSFLANGGGPTAGQSPPEDSALQPVDDYYQLLLSKGVIASKCRVDNQHHAVQLLGDTCEGDPAHTVRQRTDTFLVTYVCDAVKGFTCGG